MKIAQEKNQLFSLVVRLSILYSAILIVTPQLVTAASPVPDFYYYYSEKIHLNVSTEMITICFEETISKQEKESLISGDPILKDISEKKLPSGLVLTSIKEGFGTMDVIQAIERLNTLPEIKYSAPVFQFRNLKLILMDEFIVRFKPDITEEDIQKAE